MRFIGHLDLLKLFQRAIKRAELPIAFSMGFNPHQLVTFALPLSLGHSSIGEYVELKFEKELDPGYIVAALNNVMPDGLKIISARKLYENEKNAASVVKIAEYEIEFSEYTELGKHVENILSQEQIIICKKTKNGIKDVDIRADIFELKNISTKSIKAVLSAGSDRNLKPELLAEHIYNLMEKPFEPYSVRYKRIDLFSEKEAVFYSLSGVME